MEVEQEIFKFETNTRFDIGDFFEDETNEEALRWLMAWPNWPNNRLNIYGNYACGKSHLGNLWKKCANAYKLENTNEEIRELMTKYKAFLLDPLEPLLANECWMYDFLNICSEKNASILMISSTTDFSKYTGLKDLLSRLNAVSHVRILQPKDNLLRKIMSKIGEDLGIRLRPNVIEYIINHTDRSIEKIAPLIERANQISLTEKKPIDIKMIKDVMGLRN